MKIRGWKNNHNQNTSNASHRIASHQLNAEAISIIRQQVAPWSMQEKNRKQGELDDWLTFPVRAVVVDPEAVVLMVSGACGEYGVLPDGCPHFHPTGRANRAELRCLAESPKRFDSNSRKIILRFEKMYKHGKKRRINKPVHHVQF